MRVCMCVCLCDLSGRADVCVCVICSAETRQESNLSKR